MTSRAEWRLGIALISVLAAQTLTGLVWAGGAAARLAHLETHTERAQTLAERTARLEEQADHILASLSRIERKLDQQGADQ